jgi:TIR domain
MANAKRRAEPYRVFFSYSHKDRWIAKQCVRLIEELAKGKIHAFLDAKDIEVGGDITEEVLASIRRCNEFVVLLSANSNGKPWVQFEIGVARGRQKPVMAILHNLNPQEMPDMIYTHKSVDLNDFEAEYLEQLRKRLLKWRS